MPPKQRTQKQVAKYLRRLGALGEALPFHSRTTSADADRSKLQAYPKLTPPNANSRKRNIFHRAVRSIWLNPKTKTEPMRSIFFSKIQKKKRKLKNRNYHVGLEPFSVFYSLWP